MQMAMSCHWECTRFVLGDGRVCMCVSYMCLLRLILRQILKEECRSVQLCMRKCVL